MRNFLNGILSFIGSESLTDSEYARINLVEQTYSVATYNALKEILESRESVSRQLSKLKTFFGLKGVNVSGDKVPTPRTNIFLGARLG